MLPLRRIVVLALLLAGCVPSEAPQAPAAPDATLLAGRVSRVIDGDTFILAGEPRRVRVWGLDAPEWNHRGGSTATAAMRGLISGKTLRCQVHDIDRYGRYVGQCFLPDGRDITAEMLRMGVAREYCFFSRNHYGTCRG